MNVVCPAFGAQSVAYKAEPILIYIKGGGPKIVFWKIEINIWVATDVPSKISSNLS